MLSTHLYALEPDEHVVLESVERGVEPGGAELVEPPANQPHRRILLKLDSSSGRRSRERECLGRSQQVCIKGGRTLKVMYSSILMSSSAGSSTRASCLPPVLAPRHLVCCRHGEQAGHCSLSWPLTSPSHSPFLEQCVLVWGLISSSELQLYRLASSASRPRALLCSCSLRSCSLQLLAF